MTGLSEVFKIYIEGSSVCMSLLDNCSARLQAKLHQTVEQIKMHFLYILPALLSLALALPRVHEEPFSHEAFTRRDGSVETRLRYRGLEEEHPDHTTEITLVQRAAADTHSNFLFGNTRLYWGCNVDPIKEIDHMSDICIDTQCDENQDYSRDIDYLDISKGGNPGAPAGKKLTLKAKGFFPTGQRNAIVKSLQTAAGGKNLIKWTKGVKWAEAGTQIGHGASTPTLRGTCDIAQFTNTIGIKISDKEDRASVNIQLNFSIEDQTALSGFCKAVDVGSSVAGAFGAPGAGAAAFLGVVKATCS